MGVKGQVIINSFGVPVTQDFNTLANTGTLGNTLPLGWAFYETPSDGFYRVGDGLSSQGDTYSFGTGAEVDRALGGLRSGSLIPTFGANFTNNTGGIIAELAISYTGEQWRIGTANRADRLVFEYSLDATGLDNGDWSPVPALDFLAPVATGTARALNGNASANRTPISASITNLFIPNGTSFWIRWADFEATGVDDGLAVDDFSITASNPCDVVVSSFSPVTGPVGTVVIITGTNFTGATSVSFNGINSTFTVNSNTQITATVPAGAASGPIVVSNNSCSSLPNGSFDVIDENCGTLATSLYISEYVEGSGNNKAIEIANFTGANVNLSNYQLRSYHNGSTTPLNPPFSFGNVNLPNGEVYVVVVNTASAALKAYADAIYNAPGWFNGDDAVILFNTSTNSNVDIFGNIGCDPGSYWSAPGIQTMDRTLVRNPNVNAGIIVDPDNDPPCDFPSLATEWLEFSEDDYSNLRSHTTIFAGSPPNVSNLAQPVPVCIGSTRILSVTATGGGSPFSFQWKVLLAGSWQNVVDAAGVYSGAGTSALTITGGSALNGLQYYCEVGNSGTPACTKASNAVQLMVNVLPTPTATSNSPVCAGSALNLTGLPNGMTSYSWTGPNGFTSLVQNPSINNVTLAAAGLYTLTVTDGNTCSAAATTTVVINALPVVDCPDDYSVCINAVQFLLTDATPAGGTYSGNGVIGNNFNPATAGLGDHEILYTYTDGSNCISTCTFTITVKTATVEVTGTTPPTSDCYPDLRTAFISINDRTHQGDITVSIHENTFETATATLIASGPGLANYTTVNIFPTAAVTVSGNLNAPLVQLDGADNVTFDGRINATGASYSLSLSNTNTGNLVNTIAFTGGATNDIIQYCNITGSNAIYSLGAAGNTNNTNTIQHNHIYDFLNVGLASNGIHLAANNENWNISENDFYQSATLNSTANVAYAAIRIDAGTGNGFVIQNNTIGSNTAGGTVNWVKTGSDNAFYGIYFAGGTAASNTISGNSIRNITWTNTGNANWTGIHIQSGTAAVSGNTIGAASGTENIAVTLGATTTVSNGVLGINHFSGNETTIENNIIGGITSNNSALANATNIYGIIKTGTVAQLTISGNQIIGLQASSTSTGNAQIVYGIAYEINGVALVQNNTIQDLSNLSLHSHGQVHGIHTVLNSNTITGNAIFNLSCDASNVSGGIDAAVIGIVSRFNNTGQQITHNTIYNLSSTSTARGRAIGIYFHGSQDLTNQVSENFIYNLSVASVTAGPPFGEIFGIRNNYGSATFSNNIINLGVGLSASAYIYGIYESGNSGSNNNYYHNTLYIGGNSTQNENNSYAFFSGNNVNRKDIQNNIFHNARTSSTGVTAFHYATHYQLNANRLTSDYNVYYYPSGRFVRIGPPSPHNFFPTLADWQVAYPGLDRHSVVANSSFAIPGGTLAANYIPGTSYNGIGTVGILTDYAGTTRNCAFTRGAFETAPAAVTAVFDPETSTRCQGAGTVIYADSALVLNDAAVVYKMVSIPAGATLLDAGTGEVSYPAGWSGTVTITLTATGCDGSTATATHIATTTGDVEVPVFPQGETSTRCIGEEPLTVSYAAIPQPQNSAVFTYALAPAGSGTIDTTTGEVTWDATYTGTAIITATAEGCGDDQTATHTVTITPGVSTPVFFLGAISSRCQGAGIVLYEATATNATGIVYSLDQASLDAGVTINSATGEVTYPGTWVGPAYITASAEGCNGPATAIHEALSTDALPVSVSITVNPPAVCAGGTQTFTAVPVNGGTSPVYRWELNGFNVGTNSNVYGPVALNDGDQMQCFVTSDDPCAQTGEFGSNVITVAIGVVEVTATAANLGPLCYPNLGVAFDSINNGFHQGTITVRINGPTTEPVTAVLNASGGLSSYTSVIVYPNVTGISVTGDIDGPLLHLNGADGVTLHGSPGGTGTNRSITYINTSTGSNATTIQINNGAATNTITYCNLRGSGTGTDRGTVYIGGGGANTNNSILRNAFTGNGDNRPANSVYSFNGTGNNTVFVEFNEFYNFFSLSNNSNGVYLHTGTGTSRINDNRFYETSSFSPTADAEYAVIRFISMGSNTQINRNTIGGNTNAQNSHWIKQREHNT